MAKTIKSHLDVALPDIARVPEPVRLKQTHQKTQLAGASRRQIDAMRLAQALRDYVSDSGIEVIHIESVWGIAPNYGLTTMGVLRAVLVLRSYRHIGWCKFDGQLQLISLNPGLFAPLDSTCGVMVRKGGAK